jgi:putative FmdB family regulatory protein
MPLYDYDCAQCGRRFEVIHGVHADGPTACPLCGGGPVRKAITAPAVHFKGSGWAKKERRAGMTSSRSATDGEGSSSGSGGDGGTAAPAKTDGAKTDGSKSDAAKGGASKTESPTSDRPKEAGTTASSTAD